jgi:hypothetical protein
MSFFDNSSMLGAYFQQRIRDFFSAESLHWVSTMKGERPSLCQGVPHLFEFKRNLRPPFSPQQSNHLTESYDAPIFVSCTLSRTRNERTNNFLETHGIGAATYYGTATSLLSRSKQNICFPLQLCVYQCRAPVAFEQDQRCDLQSRHRRG